MLRVRTIGVEQMIAIRSELLALQAGIESLVITGFSASS
jgi:hypothetical protein